MKDKAILLGWIIGILLLISVLWISIQSVHAFYILRAVNSVFMNNDDSRRVSKYLHAKAGKAETLGFWYSMNSADKMFVFTVFKDGILVPLGAIVSPNGTVSEIFPLSAHAVQIFDGLPKSILQMYVGRIEEAALENFSIPQGAVR
ncbi:hypothetical protein R84B8_00232 [Treponema sp. R8-4-B8]